MGFLLSAQGYAYLTPTFPRRNPGFADAAFLAGMRTAQQRLNDPPVGSWEAAISSPSMP